MAEATKALKWDQASEKLYETGVKKVALYVMDDNGEYRNGVAWNGVTAVTESPSGAEETALFADDIKYLSLRSAEQFGATIEAYMYPDEWKECDGRAMIDESLPGVEVSQQARRAFGLVYMTTIGNDVQNNDYGSKLHILYNGTVPPSERAYQTINDSPEAVTFSWEITTTPIDVEGTTLKPTSLITIDSVKLGTDKFKKLTDYVYGTTTTDPKLPTPKELVDLLKAA